jgi:hypothetical protein
MSKSSINLSERIFLTVDYWDGHAYIGELKITVGDDGKLQQKKLVELTPEELAELTHVLTKINIREV